MASIPVFGGELSINKETLRMVWLIQADGVVLRDAGAFLSSAAAADWIASQENLPAGVVEPVSFPVN